MCPLCSSRKATEILKLDARELEERWDSTFGVRISRELGFESEIRLLECGSCRLQYFVPQGIAGSSKLYEQLMNLDWYYNPYKWEHRTAESQLRNGDDVLEIGCGLGHFVERLAATGRINACGIELNARAVDLAHKAGRPVLLKSVEEMGRERPQSFDVVCSFQVLEHVSRPRDFLRGCVELLRPGGRLHISVPNSAGFIRLDPEELLNSPPHHVTRWSEPVFAYLPKLFPIRLLKTRFEPLAKYHERWFAGLQANRLPEIRYLRGVAARALRLAILPLTRATGLRRFLRGHTIFVCYEKHITRS